MRSPFKIELSLDIHTFRLIDNQTFIRRKLFSLANLKKALTGKYVAISDGRTIKQTNIAVEVASPLEISSPTRPNPPD